MVLNMPSELMSDYLRYQLVKDNTIIVYKFTSLICDYE